MRARLLVFPIKGRNWCFTRSNINRLIPESDSGQNPSTLTALWKKISSNSDKPISSNAEVVIDFFSYKMNTAWNGLEIAPEGTIKKKIHGLGLKLLASVRPSEIFLKSITKEVSQLEVTYPLSLNERLVRRRLRHIATRGTIIHKKYFYGSVTLLPLTTVFTILPLPNIPFFWILFRTYSHWRALQGSERLLHLISNTPESPKSIGIKTKRTEHDQSNSENNNSRLYALVLQPSQELENFYRNEAIHEGLSETAISEICGTFDLNKLEIVKYKDTM